MPKGVVWRHEDVFMALGGGIDPITERPGGVAGGDGGPPHRRRLHLLPLAPLMHGATQWGVMGQLFGATRWCCLGPSSTPRRCWRTVGEEKAQPR